MEGHWGESDETCVEDFEGDTQRVSDIGKPIVEFARLHIFQGKGLVCAEIMEQEKRFVLDEIVVAHNPFAGFIEVLGQTHVQRLRKKRPRSDVGQLVCEVLEEFNDVFHVSINNLCRAARTRHKSVAIVL